MKKKCFKCGLEKDIRSFYRHKQMSDGHLGKCKDCAKGDVRLNYKTNPYPKQYDLERYRHNFKRQWQHKYQCMKRRISGCAKHSNLKGKDLLDIQSFMGWCEDNVKTYSYLHKNWEASNFQRKLAPSIDRINNKLGYVVGNMRWITQQENSIKYNK